MRVTEFCTDWRDGGMSRGQWSQTLDWPSGVEHGTTMYEHELVYHNATAKPWWPSEPALLVDRKAQDDMLAQIVPYLNQYAPGLRGRVLFDCEVWTPIERIQLERDAQQTDPAKRFVQRWRAAIGRANSANSTYDAMCQGFWIRAITEARVAGYDPAFYDLPYRGDVRPNDYIRMISNQSWICLTHYFRDPNHSFVQWAAEVADGIKLAKAISPTKTIMILIALGYELSDVSLVPVTILNRAANFVAGLGGGIELGIWGAIPSEQKAPEYRMTVSGMKTTLTQLTGEPV